jgi:hypothetical protein
MSVADMRVEIDTGSPAWESALQSALNLVAAASGGRETYTKEMNRVITSFFADANDDAQIATRVAYQLEALRTVASAGVSALMASATVEGEDGELEETIDSQTAMKIIEDSIERLRQQSTEAGHESDGEDD